MTTHVQMITDLRARLTLAETLHAVAIKERNYERHRALAAEQVIAQLRAWMAEYPDDKYTGTWWLAELDRILGKGTP